MTQPGAKMSGRAFEPTGQVLTAPWFDDTGVRRVLRCLEQAGHEARIVGGAIRDTLQAQRAGRSPPKRPDIDIATTAEPDAVVAAAAAAGHETRPTGIEHGTVTVLVRHEPFEVTTLRQDIDTDGRRAQVAFGTDWLEDARRRDFTINAIYCDADGQLYDPVGGLTDLTMRRLAFIGDARTRIREDYLRTLRFYRFSAKLPDFSRDPTGDNAAATEHAGLSRLSAERVAKELRGLFTAPGAVSAVAAMIAHGVFAKVLPFAPHMARLDKVIRLQERLEPSQPQLDDTGKPDNVTAMLRLAATTCAALEDASRLASHLKLSNAERKILVSLGAALNTQAKCPANDREVRALIYGVPEPLRPAFLIYRHALSREPVTDRAWAHAHAIAATWNPPEFPVRAGDLISLGVKPGPSLGEKMRMLQDQWRASDFTSDRETLLAGIKKSP